MDLLWQKEPRNHELYVDIFKNMSTKDQNLDSYLIEIAETSARLAALNFHKKNNKVSSHYRKKGNTQFQKENWLESMNLYNQSLCYAEIGSENVSLAYANRSSSFLHLKMYNECLVDIELAKQANYPTKLMPKLEKRRADCLKLMDKYEGEYKLSYETDEHFPGMANVLEIRCDKKFGRHIVAKADIPAGKIILAEKTFITHYMKTRYNSCATCMSVSRNFIACTQCTSTLFCDSKCADSNEAHRMDCQEDFIYTEPSLEYYMNAILFLLSIFTNVECLIEFVLENVMQKRRPSAPKSLADVECKFQALLQLAMNKCPIAELIHQRLKEAYTTYNTLLMRKSIKKLFETEQKRRFLMHLVLHINCVMKNNGFKAGKIQLNLYIIASYFNHSCAFNVIGLSSGENVRYCKTVRPIKSGQQLFISYFGGKGFDYSEEYRQKFLYDNFGFQCKCERCKPDMRLWAMNSFNMQLDQDFQNYNKYLINGGDQKMMEERRAMWEQTLTDVLNQYGDKHWCDALACVIDNYDGLF